MASVSSFNEKSWRISFFDASKSPKRKVFYFKKKSFYKDFGLTKKQAEKTAWEMEHKHRTGEVDLWEKQTTIVTDVKISEAIELWHKQAVKTLSKNTLESRLYMLNKFARDMGNIYVKNLSSEALNDYVNSPKNLYTRNNRRTMINSLYKVLNNSGFDFSISVKVLSTKQERKDQDQIDENHYITKAELFEICKAHEELIHKSTKTYNLATNKKLTIIFKLLFFTGMRRNDILHLKPEWLSEDMRLLTIGDSTYTPKSQKKSETVALLPEARQLFSDHIDIFPLNIHGDHVTKRFKKAVKLALKSPRDTSIHLHSLRHSFVIYCLDDLSLPERIVKQLTRHDDHRTFARYTHKNITNVLHFLDNKLC